MEYFFGLVKFFSMHGLLIVAVLWGLTLLFKSKNLYLAASGVAFIAALSDILLIVLGKVPSYYLFFALFEIFVAVMAYLLLRLNTRKAVPK